MRVGDNATRVKIVRAVIENEHIMCELHGVVVHITSAKTFNNTWQRKAKQSKAKTRNITPATKRSPQPTIYEYVAVDNAKDSLTCNPW